MISLFAFIGIAAAIPTPNIDIDGACPGPATIHVDHASPNARIAIARARGPGSFVIPSGHCAGVNLNLASPAIATTGVASAGGEKTWTPTLAAPACGQWLVAIDLDTCRVSAPMPITPPPTDRWDLTLDAPATPYNLPDVARDTSWVMSSTGSHGETTLVRVDDRGTVLSSVTSPESIYALFDGPSGVVALGAQRFDPVLGGYGFTNPLVTVLNGVLTPSWASMYTDGGDFSAAVVGLNGEVYAAGTMEAKFDGTGAVQWTATRTPAGRINNVAAMPDGYITSGWSWLPGGNGAATVYRVAADGSTVWGTAVTRGQTTSGHAVLALGDEALVLVADDGDVGSTLVRFDRAGAVQWSRMYTAPSAPYLFCYDIVPGWAGYSLVCSTWDASFNPLDTVLVKVDTEGEVQYARTYGPGSLWQGHVAGNLGMVMAGTDPSGAARLIRVDANGQTGCDQPYDVVSQAVSVTASSIAAGASPAAPPLSHPAVTIAADSVTGLDVCF
jgi:hypothetical protein